jgi:hypothetical protein
MTQRISEAIDIFLDAINNGTLAKGSCHACAVGNLVAAGQGGIISLDFDSCTTINNAWGNLFSSNYYGKQYFNTDYLNHLRVIENIEATKFTLKELMKIENAFEKNTKINCYLYSEYSKEQIRKDQIKGLEAAVKVMLEFDDQQDDVKEVFTRKAELIAI